MKRLLQMYRGIKPVSRKKRKKRLIYLGVGEFYNLRSFPWVNR